jgi:hypothetical protein
MVGLHRNCLLSRLVRTMLVVNRHGGFSGGANEVADQRVRGTPTRSGGR